MTNPKWMFNYFAGRLNISKSILKKNVLEFVVVAAPEKLLECNYTFKRSTAKNLVCVVCCLVNASQHCDTVWLILFSVYFPGHHRESHQTLCVLSPQRVCPDEVSKVRLAKGKAQQTLCFINFWCQLSFTDYAKSTSSHQPACSPINL